MPYIGRIKKIKEQISLLENHGLLVSKEENKKYLSGFNSSHYYVLLTSAEGFLLTDGRYFEAAEENQGKLTPILLTRNFTLFDFMNQIGLETLSFEADGVTFKFFEELQTKVSKIELIPAQEWIEQSRMIKDLVEIEKLRKAEAIGDEAFVRMLSFVKEGISERELSIELEFQMKRLGAAKLSFETICASGERSSLPHGVASDRRLKLGEFITFDFGCVFEDYCSDMTRTVALSHVTKEMETVYNLVKEAQQAGLAAVAAGKKCVDIDSASRNIIEYSGYGNFFSHGLGHGVGLQIHEAPTLSTKSTEILAENMAITIEPGIYLPKKFGVRIEDLVIVKRDGYENLSSLNKELMIVNGG